MNDIEIATRNGLPEHLRKLADKFPRENWEYHQNFNSLTQFWLSRHIMFRDLLGRLQADTQKLIELDKQYQSNSTLSRMTGFFLHQLHGHHSVEDHHYFPLLLPLDDDLSRGFEILDADHQALDKNIHDLAQKTKLLLSVINSANDPRHAAEEVFNAQNNFGKFLNRHLCDEEELIVPIILKYGGSEWG
jgi:iron-sulfur cluster repair protein YtfE (RIC family)